MRRYAAASVSQGGQEAAPVTDDAAGIDHRRRLLSGHHETLAALYDGNTFRCRRRPAHACTGR